MENCVLLLPFIVLGATALGILWAIAFSRSIKAIRVLALTGLFCALASLWPAARLSAGPTSFAPFFSFEAGNLFFATLVIGSATAGILCLRYVSKESFFFLLLATLGASITVSTDHFVILLLGLKLLSLSFCVLVAETRSQIHAAMRLFVAGEVFLANALFAAGVIYFKTGTLEISMALDQLPPTLIAALLGIMALGLGITIAWVQAGWKIVTDRRRPLRQFGLSG